MKIPAIRSTTLVLAACIAAGAVWAQATPRSGTAQLSKADVAFLKQAAENGHAEVESGKLALQKVTRNEPLRRFAQTMVDDHQKSGEELRALATSKGVEVPSEPSMLQRAKLKVLSAADGDAFSRRYVEDMGVEAHKETIELFQRAARGADDAEVKAFASKTMPTLQKHMTLAQDLHGTHPSQGSTGGRQQSPATGR